MEEEFGRFVAARGRALCRTAYLLTGDWQVGEDLVQEALTRTYLRRRRLRSAEALEPYARKVLVSLFLTSRRRQWHKELPVANVPDHAVNGSLKRPKTATDCGRRSSRCPPSSGLCSCFATSKTSPRPRSRRCSRARQAR